MQVVLKTRKCCSFYIAQDAAASPVIRVIFKGFDSFYSHFWVHMAKIWMGGYLVVYVLSC
jgi:hypothetical protein